MKPVRWFSAVVLGLGFAACSSDDSGDDPAGGSGGSSTVTGGRATSGATSSGSGGVGASSGGAKSGTGGNPSASGGAKSGSGGNPSGGITPMGEGRGAGSGEGGGAGSGEGGGAGKPTTPSPNAPRPCENLEYDDRDFSTVIEVGPGREAETPSDVPWESLEPGTLVRIHPRAEPYRDKWVVNARGTEAAPIVVVGVPEDGKLPVISGDGAETRPELDFWNEPRGIVKIGGANVGDGAAHVTIACLDINSGKPGIEFQDASGETAEYAENAACVYLEEGEHIELRNNLIHGCGNGIFASSGSSDVLVSGNYVYDNGNAGSIYEHNSYTECNGITFEFNRYGALCDGCDGNNLKDRSAGLVVRYNWIESGNRQLDLVESDHDELVGSAAYRQTFVYGNVLIEPDGAGNSQITHYGGDGSDTGNYRKGTLYFFHNTVVSTRSGNTTLFRLSSEDESVAAHNNVFSVSANPGTLAVSAGMGAIELAGNWLPSGFRNTHDTLTGSIDDRGNVEGTLSGFADASTQDFTLSADSDCIDAAGSLPDAVESPALVYVKHQSGSARPDDGAPDIGAYERE